MVYFWCVFARFNAKRSNMNKTIKDMSFISSNMILVFFWTKNMILPSQFKFKI